MAFIQKLKQHIGILISVIFISFCTIWNYFVNEPLIHELQNCVEENQVFQDNIIQLKNMQEVHFYTLKQNLQKVECQIQKEINKKNRTTIDSMLSKIIEDIP